MYIIANKNKAQFRLMAGPSQAVISRAIKEKRDDVEVQYYKDGKWKLKLHTNLNPDSVYRVVKKTKVEQVPSEMTVEQECENKTYVQLKEMSIAARNKIWAGFNSPAWNLVESFYLGCWATATDALLSETGIYRLKPVTADCSNPGLICFRDMTPVQQSLLKAAAKSGKLERYSFVGCYWSTKCSEDLADYCFYRIKPEVEVEPTPVVFTNENRTKFSDLNADDAVLMFLAHRQGNVEIEVGPNWHPVSTQSPLWPDLVYRIVKPKSEPAKPKFLDITVQDKGGQFIFHKVNGCNTNVVQAPGFTDFVGYVYENEVLSITLNPGLGKLIKVRFKNEV